MFALELTRAYLRYAELLGLKSELVYESESSYSIRVSGRGVEEAFARESGKHVVQRVPRTESRGRRHTSVVAVAVLSLPERLDRSLAIDEVEVKTQRGHGSGGQNQNKVESAVRVTHKPSGITVFINGRDQYRNKQLALEILAARLHQSRSQAALDARSRAKAAQIAYGSRSGKVRTYNFINGYVLDHRTGNRTSRIGDIFKGRFDLI